MTQTKKDIAVFIGGRSPEHDVSVVSGLQVLGAIDPAIYNAFLVYVAPDGKWYIGDALKKRDNYLFDREAIKKLTPVTLDMNDRGALIAPRKGFLGAKKVAHIDVAVLAFHGRYGEDGAFQGLLEAASIPYTGMRLMATSILMDKAVTKNVLRDQDIPVLPCAILRRAAQGLMLPVEEIDKAMKEAKIDFPCILKPNHLGSSIGIARVKNAEEVRACLPAIFELDHEAILEPFVENLVEYNVAVSHALGDAIRFSAIERPKTTDELLDFKQKYCAGGTKGGSKTGSKTEGPVSEGMLSLTRELNPEITQDQDNIIRQSAAKMFALLGGTGAPRIDFIGNSQSREIWLNEVNPIPGSFGYFLWEAAEDPVLFSELLDALIAEAIEQHQSRGLPRDPVPKDARLLKRAL